jgi:hypothetical protein
VLNMTLTSTLKPGKGLDVQVHDLISLGGWTDVTFICLSSPNRKTCVYALAPRKETSSGFSGGAIECMVLCEYTYLNAIPGHPPEGFPGLRLVHTMTVFLLSMHWLNQSASPRHSSDRD